MLLLAIKLENKCPKKIRVKTSYFFLNLIHKVQRRPPLPQFEYKSMLLVISNSASSIEF